MYQVFFLMFFQMSAGSICDDRTTVYAEHGNSNANNFYFIEATYKKSGDPITSRETFIAALSKELITCTGQWCSDCPRCDWKCKNGTAECYHMEHIIPKLNTIPELSGCPLSSYNIRGNLVMSYGRWNIQLSNGHLGEKSLIYGNTIMTSAYQTVLNACKGGPGAIPQDLCLANSSYDTIAGLVMIPIAGILVAIIMYVIKSKKCYGEDNI